MGKDVWVDWADILPSADWRTKVYGGIEAAKAFVPERRRPAMRAAGLVPA